MFSPSVGAQARWLFWWEWQGRVTLVNGWAHEPRCCGAEWELGDSPSSPSLGSDSVAWLRAVVWDAQVLQGPISDRATPLGGAAFGKLNLLPVQQSHVRQGHV